MPSTVYIMFEEREWPAAAAVAVRKKKGRETGS
jgi:hypothetical protein